MDTMTYKGETEGLAVFTSATLNISRNEVIDKGLRCLEAKDEVGQRFTTQNRITMEIELGATIYRCSIECAEQKDGWPGHCMAVQRGHDMNGWTVVWPSGRATA